MDLTRSRNILYVTHRVPYPPDKGDRIRTFHTLNFLAKTHQVHLACLTDEPVEQKTHEVLDGLCKQVAIVPVQKGMRTLRMGWSVLSGGIGSVSAFHSTELSRIIESWSKKTDFDLVMASASSTAPYLDVPHLRSVPAVIDLVDVDSEKWLNYSAATSFPKSWVYRREGVALRKYEQKISSWAKAILLVSDAESRLFRSIAPDAPIHTVTNGVDLEYFQPTKRPSCEHQCVFVGALDYHPNIDAVCWFAARIWPEIRKNHPQAVFEIVGRRPTPAVLALANIPGIEVVGQVPDVRPYVHRATLVVAPLRIARGLQNKVLEAMAMAKPVIASPAALAGLHLNIPNPAIQVNTVEEWVAAVNDLFSDQQHRQELAAKGRAYVETHYDWNRCLEPLQELIESLTQAKPTGSKTRSSSQVAV